MLISKLHHSYQVHKESLQYLSHSERNQILLIDKWLNELLSFDQPHLVMSYLLEEIALLFRLAPMINPIGCTPELFSNLSNKLQHVIQLFPDAFKKDEVEECIWNLNHYRKTIEAYLGCLRESLSNDFAIIHRPPLSSESTKCHFDERSEEKSPHSFQQEISHSPRRIRNDNPELFVNALDQSPRDILQQWIDFLHSQNNPDADEYQQIANRWNRLIKPNIGIVHIPLLEHDNTGGELSEFYPFGKIASMHIVITQQNHKATSDHIALPKTISDAEQSNMRDELQRALDTARGSVKDFINGTIPKAVSLSVNFDESQFEYAGRSLGLGSAVCMMTLFSTMAFDWKYYLIDGSTVITGCIDENGNAIPIDDAQVKLKTETIFYSPYSHFIVPKENEAAAIATLNKLQEKYPTRSLEILPVRNVRDVMNHRQAVQLIPYTMREGASRKLRKYQKHIAIISSVLVFVMIGVYLLLGVDWDKNPAQILVQDNYYVIKNKHGTELWRTLFFATDEQLTIDKDEKARMLSKLTIINDLDQDGQNEVIIAHPGQKQNFADHLYCYNYDGTLRWQPKVGLAIETQEGNYRNQLGFAFNAIALIPADSLDGTRIVTLVCNQHYTCLVNTFDVHGQKLSEYLHLGSLTALLLFQEPKTLKYSILLGGMLNAYRQNVLIKLDPDAAKGVSLQMGKYSLIYPANTPAREMYYLMFPKPDIQDFLDEKNNYIVIMNIMSLTIVQLVTYYGVLKDQSKVKDNNACLTWNLDLETMRAIAVNTSTQFDNVHDFLRSKGRISSIRDAEYKQNLMNNILYWDGDKWVNKPTMNKRYVEALNKK